jgi:hypothetical protein
MRDRAPFFASRVSRMWSESRKKGLEVDAMYPSKSIRSFGFAGLALVGVSLGKGWQEIMTDEIRDAVIIV